MSPIGGDGPRGPGSFSGGPRPGSFNPDMPRPGSFDHDAQRPGAYIPGAMRPGLPMPPKKRARPFGREQQFDPSTGTSRPLGEDRAIAEFTIEQVGLDALSCLDDGDGDNLVLVAKPWHLRDSARDGGAVGDVYTVGDKILASFRPSQIEVEVADGEFDYVVEGKYLADWVDLNVAGLPRVTRSRLKVNRADGNLLDCAILDQNGVEGVTVVVARPPELQADYYSGQTIDGVAYVHVDNTKRTGDGNDEEIVPSYVVDSSIVLIAYMPGGTGQTDGNNGDAVVVWQEITFRGWGVS